MNFKEMFFHPKEANKDTKVEEKEEIIPAETEKGGVALKEMNKAIGLESGLDNLKESIMNNPEMIIAKAEKNPEFKNKLKAFVGTTGLLLGAGAVVYSFNGPEEMSVALRELSRLLGLVTAGASAVSINLGDKFGNIKVPDWFAKIMEGK